MRNSQSQKTNSRQEWDLIISPNRNLWDLRLKEIWQYRDLIKLFVRRNFVAAYKQTLLGPMWHFIRPIFSSSIFTLIFSGLAGLSTDDTPPFLFYMSGNLVWTYFSSCFTGTSGTFIGQRGLFQKVYFPRMIIPITSIITNMYHSLIRIVLLIFFIFIFAWNGFPNQIQLWALLTPLLVINTGLLAMSWGIIISALTTKYRDLSIFVNFALQLLFYVTPVIYPASMVPTDLQWAYFLNPIAPMVEAFRFSFLGSGTVNQYSIGYSVLVMIISLFVGLILFNKTEQNFIDTV